MVGNTQQIFHLSTTEKSISQIMLDDVDGLEDVNLQRVVLGKN